MRKKVYKLLASIEFTSERKMSSYIVEDSLNKEIWVYSKGADSVVRERLSRDPKVNS